MFLPLMPGLIDYFPIIKNTARRFVIVGATHDIAQPMVN
jgi:hypothetical protein